MKTKLPSDIELLSNAIRQHEEKIKRLEITGDLDTKIFNNITNTLNAQFELYKSLRGSLLLTDLTIIVLSLLLIILAVNI